MRLPDATEAVPAEARVPRRPVLELRGVAVLLHQDEAQLLAREQRAPVSAAEEGADAPLAIEQHRVEPGAQPRLQGCQAKVGHRRLAGPRRPRVGRITPRGHKRERTACADGSAHHAHAAAIPAQVGHQVGLCRRVWLDGDDTPSVARRLCQRAGGRAIPRRLCRRRFAGGGRAIPMRCHA